MHSLYSFLDILFLTWTFWPIVVGLPLICYGVVSSLEAKDESEAWPTLLIILAGAATLYRYPALRLTEWQTWAYAVGGYVLIGFLLTLYKWVMVLVDFRKSDVAKDIAETRTAYSSPKKAAASLGSLYRYKKCLVEVNDADGTISVRPNWHSYPLATWATYWPFFAFSVILDPIKRGIEHAIGWLKSFFDGIARRFAVKG